MTDYFTKNEIDEPRLSAEMILSYALDLKRIELYMHFNQIVGVLDQVVFSGFTHPPAIELSEKLMAILPENMAKIFFSDNGSTSVDVAIKIALQYYFNKGEKRNKVIALHNAFHGDTFGAMSVSGLSVYNGPFEDFLLRIERVAVPDEQNWESVLNEFKFLLD